MKHASGLYDQILCLGDVVGYGADPNAVTEWVREFVSLTVRGNHDVACAVELDVPEWFNGYAGDAAQWTRLELTAKNIEFLAALPEGPVEAPALDTYLMHGSPHDENEYIFVKSDAVRAYRWLPGNICFFGHTHRQTGFAMRREKVWILPANETHQLETDTAYLLNPGSVGQPRDDDPRAAYALYDSESKVLRFERVEYDIETAQDRIRDAGLPPALADRLGFGC